MKSVAYGPTQQNVRIQLRKGLNELSSCLKTWKPKGLSFVGPEKIIQKKSKGNIHLIQNVSPNVEYKLCSQEGDGGPNPV